MAMSTPPSAAPVSPPIFAEPTPLGLLGLAIGCAALLPIAFGKVMTPDALRTAAWFCLFFGGGGQLIAGLMALANKNLLGGTLFTTFSFNWFMNFWALSSMSEGKMVDPTIVLSVDICFLIIFIALMFAFGFFSKLLFVFLLDIVLLYVFRIAKDVFAAPQLGAAIAWCTVALAAIALWLAFAILVNGTAGRVIFKVPGPLFTPSSGAPNA